MGQTNESQLEDTDLDIRFKKTQERGSSGWIAAILLVVAGGLALFSIYHASQSQAAKLNAELAEAQAGLRSLQTELDRKEAASAVPVWSPPESFYDFESPSQLEEWNGRIGDWTLQDGRLRGTPEGELASAQVRKVFRGDFDAEFSVHFQPDKQVPGWGCSFLEQSRQRRYQLEFNVQDRQVRLMAHENDRTDYLGEWGLPFAYSKRHDFRVRLQSHNGIMQVWDEDRLLIGAWDSRMSEGRFGLFCRSTADFDNVRVRSEIDALEQTRTQEMKDYIEDTRRSLALGNREPVGIERLEELASNGKGFVVRGNVLICNPEEGQAWRLIGEGIWDRYILEVEVKAGGSASLFVNASEDCSGYVVELPTTDGEWVHTHQLVKGQASEDLPSKYQKTRLPPEEWQLVRLFVSPERIQVYVEHQPMHDFLPLDFPKGRLGIYGWQGNPTAFRNFRIMLPEVRDKTAGEKPEPEAPKNP